MIDRFDLQVRMARLDAAELAGPPGEASECVRARVMAARNRQLQRGGLNRMLSHTQLDAIQWQPGAQTLLERAVSKQALTARGWDRVRRVAATIADLDAVVTVSSMEPACRIDDEAEVDRTYPRQARAPFNVTGSPALAVPTGFSSDGLPLAMQIVGKPFDEATVYRVARAHEAATGWTDKHPPLGAD